MSCLFQDMKSKHNLFLLYFGQITCCLRKRLDEHGLCEDHSMHIHMSNCEEFRYMMNMLKGMVSLLDKGAY